MILFGAGTRLLLLFALMARRYGELPDRARAELGEEFGTEVAAGTRLTYDEAVIRARSNPRRRWPEGATSVEPGAPPSESW